VRLGVCASAGILRWLGKENERKPDPSHKPFTPPPGFCAELIRRKQKLGRVLGVLGWVSGFFGTPRYHTSKRWPHSDDSRCLLAPGMRQSADVPVRRGSCSA
jgi:hypothetical protein